VSRIKSAMEIALERAQKMEVTPEDLRRQQEEKCRAVGTAIAKRYLQVFDIKQLKGDLGKSSEDKNMVERAVVQELVGGALELGNYQKLENILAGVAALIGEEKINEVKGKFYVLYDGYQDALRKKEQEIETTGRKLLEQLGISGNAVQSINVEIDKEWEQDLKVIRKPFEREFALCKQELLV